MRVHLAEPLPLRASEREDIPYRLNLSETGDGYWRFSEIAHGDAFSFDFRADPVDEALFVLEATHARGVDKKLLESADELEGDLISATRVRIERAAGASKALVAGVARRYQNGENWVGTLVNLGSSAHSDVTPTSRFGR